ncbi:hypothetical protein [uncultured Helicobacter sp.]|mgnify:CR=1 FL=1|uniref:hypothetical protein n=1 Tax=uncultured Helicobacter sp. TaxID=175537 RepID=UPI001FA42B46|nr:hypothetical protein [uncultured Helicobacter sp.]HIY43531.1 hypothetical protein [Candidatus Helicobacter avistercoris]
MREELEEVFSQNEERFSKKHLYILVGVVCLGFLLYYIFTILWGTNSYEVYKGLKNEKRTLQKEVSDLENKNVELQKIIFELKGLEPTKEER